MEAERVTNAATETSGMNSRRRKPFASLVIFDTEATGLKRKPKITELCMLSVQTDELKSGRDLPRVINKLQLCFNPQSVIEVGASQITGLYNDALEQMPPFKEQASLIGRFLATQPQPTCLIAHNGLHFDFPLIQAELCIAMQSLPEGVEIWCADSLHAFRVLDGLPAVPEWLVQKENAEKQRRSLVGSENPSKRETPAEGTSSEKIGAPVIITAAPEVDSGCGSGDTSSENTPTKRPGEFVSNQSELKVPKMTTAASMGFDSQGSLPDADIAEAYDVIFSEASASVTPRQSDLETTPTSDAKQVSEGSKFKNVADQFVKKQPPPSVNAAERDRVSRRLFADQSPVTAPESNNGEHCEGTSQATAAVPSGSKNNFVPQGEQPGKANNGVSQQEGEGVASLTLTVSADVESGVPSLAPETHGTAHPSANTPKTSPSTKRLSYRLGEIYKREFRRYPDCAHAAEDDCVTLLKLIVKKSSQFITYVEDTAVTLCSIEPMF
ncbi:uncharacterized protein [Littorina saxatilis]|uniref:Exonuclease domain-containing protein n=1 Tax=Littorina saxatilis TaxID=31220 RepID=A0AAN9AXW4_9CAEN